MSTLILGSFNGKPYHTIRHFDDPPIEPVLITVIGKIPLTTGESGL